MGPLMSERQRDRVAGFVDAARDGGATVLTGGQALDRAGWFFAPTVVTDVNQQDDIINARCSDR